MNASERALGVELATKIASVVNLFRAEFPDARADLKPWRNDPETREWMDPDSIDIGFHLPGWSPRFQSRSMLVQIRFFTDPLDQVQTFIGIETAGFNHQGEAWRLSTIAQWQLVGDYQPAKDVCDRLQRFSQKAFELFASGNSDAVT
ncbi:MULTISPECIES: hypothetical protein [Cyanophyceae]|uniref:hypothetical protein n=1 Tax=Cyanophyceae TaxID=3028117 RepID=UPI00016DC49D|nr:MULTISPECIES: hypothetical protein [Cyanophyceae]ACA98949.1 conserved hypothetical protein [Picosynechococcus sp. PCC 7002]AMA08707.1 hypothetical protein AWQ23_04885 [Picosynechococcus sp. PCC 73109]ANV90008.1 hypothetical protein AWQ24_04830 [Picosynechococcus sp. PCC 8807]SMH36597.1 hypothetical protein SAMN06272755_0778 [Picosynechococcus sp. OG1]SMQ77733.1 hypothetical protein SAMN06272774_0057 [Synechococcus sp. 7002]